jgi:Na+-driven multidrug efflux pump
MLWGAPPSFMGICRGQYFAATHRISMDFPTVLTKSILTVTLTFAWTPAHGAVGAAWAATTAAWIGTYLVPWFQPSLRAAFPEQWRAFLAPRRFGRYAGMIPALFQRSWAEATSVLKPSAEPAGPGDPPHATPPS